MIECLYCCGLRFISARSGVTPSSSSEVGLKVGGSCLVPFREDDGRIKDLVAWVVDLVASWGPRQGRVVAVLGPVCGL